MELTGFAFVTGGGSGLGKACCIAFAKGGARGLVVADISLEAARKTVSESQAVAKDADFKAEAVHIDVTSEESVETAITQTVAIVGRIDYCVHSAGIPVSAFDEIAESKPEDFRRVMEVNAHGTYLVNRYASITMKSQEAVPVDLECPGRGLTRGAIVNMASTAAVATVPYLLSYNTSKHAVVGITRSAALDNVTNYIRVNCVCPGWSDTPMAEVAEDYPGMAEGHKITNSPMQRMARPDEVADCALFLCSSMSSFMTGSSLVVDGGSNLLFKQY